MNIEKEREAFLEWHFLEWKLNCAVTDTVEDARKLYGRIYKPLHHDQISEREHGFKAWMAGKSHEAKKLEGCVVVPVEPTQDMIDAAQEKTPHFHHGDSWYGTEEISEGQAEACYKAMVEAARGGK